MNTFHDPGTLVGPDIYDAGHPRMPLAQRIVRHWITRLLITWIGFGLLTAALVAGLQAMSVDISPIVSIGVLAVCVVLAVFAVTWLIERRNPADIGLSLRRLVTEWLKGAGVGGAYLCASVGILALFGGYRITGLAFVGQSLAVVSGTDAPTDSLFQPLIQGDPWLTGGAFGIEASVISVVLGLGLGIYFIVHAVRQKRTMRGLWWRGGINVLSNVRHT